MVNVFIICPEKSKINIYDTSIKLNLLEDGEHDGDV